jgi:hypothetical protein
MIASFVIFSSAFAVPLLRTTPPAATIVAPAASSSASRRVSAESACFVDMFVPLGFFVI